jgi:hypothetical protein
MRDSQCEGNIYVWIKISISRQKWNKIKVPYASFDTAEFDLAPDEHTFHGFHEGVII